MRRNIIYLPGLGDQRSRGQKFLLKLWQLPGRKIYYHQINWADGERFEPKFKRIVDQINKHSTDGKVSLIGVSAGATAAINAYCSRPDKIESVVLICGKIHHPDNVNPKFYIKNPAFEESIKIVQGNLKKLSSKDKAKMMTLQPRNDTFVPPGDSQIDGVRSVKMKVNGHIKGIAAALTFYFLSIIRFIEGS